MGDPRSIAEVEIRGEREKNWLEEYSRGFDSLEAVRKIWPELMKSSQYDLAYDLRKKYAPVLAEAQELAVGECRDRIAKSQRKAIEAVDGLLDSEKEKIRLDAAGKMVEWGNVVDKTTKIHHLVEYQNAVKAMGFDTVDTTFTESEKNVQEG